MRVSFIFRFENRVTVIDVAEQRWHCEQICRNNQSNGVIQSLQVILAQDEEQPVYSGFDLSFSADGDPNWC